MRNRERKAKENGTERSTFWEVVWSIREATPTDNGELQPDVNVNGDRSLFTRQMDTFKPEWIAEILRLVKVSPDISDDQR